MDRVRPARPSARRPPSALPPQGWGVAVWDMQHPLDPVFASRPVWVSSVAFSADGDPRRLRPDGGIDRFARPSLRPWQVLPKLTDHTRAVLAVRFNRQGLLASSADDGTGLLHDAAGQLVADILCSAINWAADWPSARTAGASRSARDAAILLDVNPDSWRAHACAVVGPLTHFGQGQWAKYRGSKD